MSLRDQANVTSERPVSKPDELLLTNAAALEFVGREHPAATRSDWLAILKITGLYAATALLGIAAAHGTAAFHGIRDARAGEMSMITVAVFTVLWILAMYRILFAKHHG